MNSNYKIIGDKIFLTLNLHDYLSIGGDFKKLSVSQFKYVDNVKFHSVKLVGDFIEAVISIDDNKSADPIRIPVWNIVVENIQVELMNEMKL